MFGGGRQTGDAQASLRCLLPKGLYTEVGVEPEEATQRLFGELEGVAQRTSLENDGLENDGRAERNNLRPEVFLVLLKRAFVGRERDLERLSDHLALALSGQGRAVAIEGEAGVGKTRLVEEFLAPLTGLHVLSGRCFERELSAPLEPIFAALGSLGETNPQPLADDVRPWSDDPHVRSSVHQTLTAKLVQAARGGRGTVLWIDDVQWADAATLEFLSYAAKRVQGEAVLVLLTYRREHRADLQGWLTHLAERRALTSLPLGRLDAEVTRRLLISLSCESFTDSARLADSLHRETEGNPYFVMEYLRWLYDTGALDLDDAQQICGLHRAVPEAGLPEGIRTLLMARYHSLPETTRELLDAAAVIGRRFDLELLEAVCPYTPAELWSAFAPLLTMGLVTELPTQEPTEHYALSHDKLRQTVYDGMAPPLRRSLHALLAEVLQHHFDPSELAHHCLRARLWPQAFDAIMAAVEEAVEVTSAWGSALQGLARAEDILDFLPEGNRKRFEVLRERERLLEHLHRLNERAATVEEMVVLAERLGDPPLQATAQLERMSVRRDYGEEAGAREAQRLAIDLFTRSGDEAAVADVYREAGYAAWKNSDYGGVLEAGFTALGIYQRLGNRRAEAATTGNIAQAYKRLGKHNEALEWAGRAADIYQELGSRLGLYLRLDTQAWICEQQGELSAAKALLEQLIVICEALGDKHLQLEKQLRLGRVCRDLAEPRRALEHFRAAARLGATTGAASHESHPLLYVAATLEHLGEFGEAVRTYERVVQLLETAYAVTGVETELVEQADALTLLAGVLHRTLARPGDALRCFGQAESIYHQQGQSRSLSRLLMERATLHWQQKAFEASRDDFQKACALAVQDGDVSREAAALASLGVVYRELAQPDRSIETSLEALEVVTRLGDAQAESYVLTSLARSYRSCHRLPEARDCLERSLHLRRDFGDLAGEEEVRRELGSLIEHAVE